MTDTKLTSTQLLVLARTLVGELDRYNHHEQWVSSPLDEVLASLLRLLDYHPDRLGDVIYRSLHSTSSLAKGQPHVSIATLPQYYPQFFAQDRQWYLDQYTAGNVSYDSSEKASSIYAEELLDLLQGVICSIVHAYIELTPQQESHHRAVENIVKHVAPICYRASQRNLQTAAVGLKELDAYMRGMATAERRVYMRRYFSECL
jgi:hypothetical protein